MSAFLAQLGKSLAERWLALLVLPGLLWSGTAVAAYHLGQARPLDPRPLNSWLDHLTGMPAAHRLSAVILASVAVLLASAVAGLAAGGLGAALRHLWTAPAIRPPLAWVLAMRRKRWARLREKAREAIAASHDPELSGAASVRAEARAKRAQRRRLTAPRQAPERATRIAERFHTSGVRAETLYGLDLELAWPRLWTVLPDGLRGDIAASQDSYNAAARLAAWGLMYAGLAVLWWPAALIGVVVLATATVRARAAATVLAALIDTAVDLHLTELAGKLCVEVTVPLTPDAGQAITLRLSG